MISADKEGNSTVLESIGISVLGDTTSKVTFDQSTEGYKPVVKNWIKGIMFWVESIPGSGSLQEAASQ